LCIGTFALLGSSTSASAATCAEEYCYDSLGRLQVALLCGTEYRYSYDASGNLIERTVSAGSSPLICDADSDGLPDTAETDTGTFASASDTGTDPYLDDTDGDGLADGAETQTGIFVSASDTGSDPHDADSDDDGVSDGDEVAAGTDPNAAAVSVPALTSTGSVVLTSLLLLAGAVLAWRVKRARGLAAIALLALPGLTLFSPTARAAVCGPGAVTLGVGEAKSNQIRAAAADETLGATSYTVVSNTAPAAISPASQDTLQLANFQITGTSLGSGIVQIDWSAASGNTGSCSIHIDVVAAPPPPTSANNFDAPSWGGVDLFTGERVFNLGSMGDGHWTLLDLGGPLPLGFSMGYASARTRDGQLSSALGDNWSHYYEARLFTAGSETRVALAGGRTLRFAESGGNYTLVGPPEIPYQLVADGAEHVLLHPASHLRYRFNTAGQLVSIFDRNGNALTLSYDGALLSQVSDGASRTLDLSYDANHFLAQVGDGTRTLAFSVVSRQLAQATDAEGNTTQFSYSNAVADTPGLLTQSLMADGTVRFLWSYSASGRVTSRTAASVMDGGTGGTTSFALVGATATTTDEAGGVWSFEMDAQGNRLSLVDPDNHTSTWSYDGLGRATTFTDAEGRSSSVAYEATNGAISQVTRPDAAVATTSFTTTTDALGLVDADATATVDFDGSTRSVVRDAAGNVTSYTDAASQIWNFTYNALGQPLTATSPTSVASAFTYDTNSNVASVTDGAGNVTTYDYDVMDRLVQINSPTALVSTFSYDANNNLVATTDAAGNVTTFDYDALDRLVQATDPALGNWHFFYNTMGAPDGNLDPLGYGWAAGYDEREQLAVVDDPSGRTTEFDYDAQGNRVGATDNAGQTQTVTVSNVGAVQSFVDRENGTWLIGRNTQDEVTQVESPTGLIWQRTVDPLGRTTSVTEPGGRTVSIGRDARGDVETLTGPDGSQTSVTRNSAGQATHVTDPNGSTWTRALDFAGRTLSRTDPLGNTTTRSYDVLSRPVQATFPSGLGNVSLGYNENSQLSQLTYSDGTTHNYLYDSNSRISGASGVSLDRDATGRITESNGITTAYDAAGRTTQIDYGPGVWVRFAYDANGMLQAVADWTNPLFPALVLGRDLEGRVVSITRANGTSSAMAYDDDGQLTNLQHFGPGLTPQFEVAIVYGEDGRPKSKSRTAAVVDPGSDLGTQTIGRNSAGWPTSFNGGAIAYDALGQRLSGLGHTFVPRLDGTLESMTVGAQTFAFDNDAFGFPIQIAAGAESTVFTWNYATLVPTLAAIDQGADVQLNVFDPQTGRLLYAVDPFTDQRTDVHFDENGNAVQWTDAAGNLLLTRAYSPDGQDTAHVGDPAASGLVPTGFGAGDGWLELGDLFLLPGSAFVDAKTASALQHIYLTGPLAHNHDRLNVDGARLINGSRGPAVENLQDLLNRKGSALSTDSIFSGLPRVDGGAVLSTTDPLASGKSFGLHSMGPICVCFDFGYLYGRNGCWSDSDNKPVVAGTAYFPTYTATTPPCVSGTRWLYGIPCDETRPSPVSNGSVKASPATQTLRILGSENGWKRGDDNEECRNHWLLNLFTKNWGEIKKGDGG